MAQEPNDPGSVGVFCRRIKRSALFSCANRQSLISPGCYI
jgi:hypothetical protein